VPEEQSVLPSLLGIRVLVVDDELDTRELIQRVLTEQGADVTLVSGGNEALREVEAAAPDLLISDIGMPQMDGYQLIRRIRATEARGQRIPAVALTAFARAEDGKKELLAGFQAHIAKPVDMAELVIVVAGLRAHTYAFSGPR
jgi:CheY-like chemotaxis protein